MKVFIGKYPENRIVCCIHTKYMDNKYGYVWSDNQNKFESFLEKIESYIQTIYDKTINKLIGERKRKIKVRIDNEDLWSMDHTLAYIIHPMLVKMKSQKHGSPFVDLDDVPEKFHPDQNRKKMCENGEIEEWEIDDTVHERWEWVIDEMIWTFGIYNTDWEFDSEDKYINNEQRIIFQKRIDNGLRLFAKYYGSLWD